MLCIICNENPEKVWPKRWKCWKDNGKFAESMCKLLGLPKHPFKEDFQNSWYCSSCQKRVYNIHLIIKKWDKLQEDIAKLKLQLEKDFHETIQKCAESELSSKISTDNCDITTGFCGEAKTNLQIIDTDNATPWSPQLLTKGYQSTANNIRKRIWKSMFSAGLSSPVLANFPRFNDQKQNYFAPTPAVDDESHNGFAVSDLNSSKCAQQTTVSVAARDGSSESCTTLIGTDNMNLEHRSMTFSLKKAARETSRGSGYSDNSYLSPNGEELVHPMRFRCYRSNCIRSFASQDDLEMHTKRCHEGVKCPYICKICGKAFKWKRDMDAHLSKHSGEVTSCCHVCGKGFRTKQLLSLHLKTKHTDQGLKCKCSHCGKSFISQSKLKTHLTIHTKIYPFTCSICNKGFSAKTFLNIHKAKHFETNPYQCTTCGKSFSSPRNLRIHQYTHNQSHPFKCPICQAGSPSEPLLKKHMLKHNEEKSHKCPLCDKKFRFPSSLQKHKKIHDGEKSFICEFCKKTFIDKYKLTRHLRTHSGEKPYSCKMCQRSFATKEYLNTHTARTHADTSSIASMKNVDKAQQINPVVEERYSTQADEIPLPPFPVLTTSLPVDLNIFDNLPTEEELVARIEMENLSTLMPDENFQNHNFDDVGFNASSIIISTFDEHEDQLLSLNFCTFHHL